MGQKGDDTIIGDSAVTGYGTARGGGNDHFIGASDDDFEVGDSYSPYGKAIGGGKDELNGGPQADFLVGDSYTITGLAEGSGRDQIHARPGTRHRLRRQLRRRPPGRDLRGGPRLHRRRGRERPPGRGAGPDTCNGGPGTTAKPSASTSRGPLAGPAPVNPHGDGG